MPLRTELARRLDLVHPIIQAPMAGGADTPALVAAVCEAGGLGSIGAAYSSPVRIRELARAVREGTSRPFAINLFAPLPVPPVGDVGAAIDLVAPFCAELGLPRPGTPTLAPYDFESQLEAAIDSGAAVFSFTFGVLPADVIARIRQRMFVMGTATSVAEARALEAAGVDAVVLQGSEAGGHRGSFAGSFEAGMIGTMALVPQAVDAVAIPVVASGGIMDGRGIAAALALGASAVQLGTAFLTCDEAGVAPAYKDRILAAREDETRITRAFSGRPARGIVNRFMADVDAHAERILPFPLQNVLTRPLRTEAARQNRAEFLSLWAGQGCGMARRGPAGKLVEQLAAEARAALERVGNMG